jgi:hypothetical protein
MTSTSRRRSAFVLAAFVFLASCGSSDEDSPALSGSASESETAGDNGGELGAAFSTPTDGATVASRFTVDMTASGLEIAPAGEAIEGEGHFHVIVDDGCVDVGTVVPNDATHLHFGKAQTSAQLFLEAGDHELCLQVADGLHTALDASESIAVTVDGALPFATLTLPEADSLSTPLSVTMSAENIAIAVAGEAVAGEGHFHVMVDVPCVETGTIIPSDDSHLHFGEAQLEADLELTPGTHTLCLQVADGLHTALDITHVVSVTIA